MANRFTDTEKWSDPWFRRLTPIGKCVWDYLTDRCNHAGIWKVDMDLMSFHIGAEISKEDVRTYLDRRLVELNKEEWFIPGFIDFQYKCSIEQLDPENRVHNSIINILKKKGVYKGLNRPYKGRKDKDIYKDKEKERLDLIKKIINYLNKKTKRDFRPSAEINQKNINARLNDGFKYEDFCLVIDYKTAQWIDDPEKNEYLRPQTLFGTKFEGYLQAARSSRSTQLDKEVRFICRKCEWEIMLPKTHSKVCNKCGTPMVIADD